MHDDEDPFNWEMPTKLSDIIGATVAMCVMVGAAFGIAKLIHWWLA